MRPQTVETVAIRRMSTTHPYLVLGCALSPEAPCPGIVQSSSPMQFEHFGRGGIFLFCGTTIRSIQWLSGDPVMHIHTIQDRSTAGKIDLETGPTKHRKELQGTENSAKNYKILQTKYKVAENTARYF